MRKPDQLRAISEGVGVCVEVGKQDTKKSVIKKNDISEAECKEGGALCAVRVRVHTCQVTCASLCVVQHHAPETVSPALLLAPKNNPYTHNKAQALLLQRQSPDKGMPHKNPAEESDTVSVFRIALSELCVYTSYSCTQPIHAHVGRGQQQCTARGHATTQEQKKT